MVTRDSLRRIGQAREGAIATSLACRVNGMERVLKGFRQTHYFFRGLDETHADVQARIRARIASGEAAPKDQFVIFRWQSPAPEK
jgi:hypothetical protein